MVDADRLVVMLIFAFTRVARETVGVVTARSVHSINYLPLSTDIQIQELQRVETPFSLLVAYIQIESKLGQTKSGQKTVPILLARFMRRLLFISPILSTFLVVRVTEVLDQQPSVQPL